ncbi:MAG: DUF1080 domain-containing protein [Bryobacteraceae bacterium]
MLRVCAVLALTLIPVMAEEGFTTLFDGKTLNGWTLVGGRGRGYVVEEGNLVCPADGGGNLFTTRDYANFIFRFEFRMQPDGNNGVGIRAPLDGRTSANGMEIQIIDSEGPKYGKMRLRAEQLHGSLYDMIPARQGFLRPTGEWNEQEVMANGRHLRITVNGVIVLDNDLDIVKEPQVLKKHPGVKRSTGRIGFLGHGTRVEFRNIRVKEL